MKFALGLPCESRSGRYLASFVLLLLTSNSVWAQTDPRDEDVATATDPRHLYMLPPEVADVKDQDSALSG